MTQQRTNWARNLVYSTESLHVPSSVEEVQEIVKSCNHLRVLGSRCSFNKISDSAHHQLSLEKFNKIISLDKVNKTVTVEGGLKYGELCKFLHENGFALHNTASLPHITVAGACATGTHGSGVNNKNLPTAVSAIEFVNAKGEIVNLSRAKDGEHFKGAVVSLGSLGVITKLTLDLVPTFDMQQVVYTDLPMQALEKNFMEIMSCAYSVSLFTTYENKNIKTLWIKSKIENGVVKSFPSDYHGAKLATKKKHVIDDQYAGNSTEQLGKPGPWYERIFHFKMEFMPSIGEELQSELFVPIEHAYKAMMAIESLSDQISPYLYISEIRTIKGDDLWMSPCYKRDCVAFHFTWLPQYEKVIKLVSLVEEKLAPFGMTPHWGKLFTIPPNVIQKRIEKLPQFKKLLNYHDPQGKFRQGFVEEQLYNNDALVIRPKL